MNIIQAPVLLAGMVDKAVIFPLSDLIGFQAEFIRLYLLFLATFPTGLVMHFCIHGKVARHLFSLVVGFLMQAYLYRYEVFHTAAITLGTQLIMSLSDRQKQHKYVFAWNFFYLSLLHIENDFLPSKFGEGQYDMNIRNQTMALVLRLISLSFCYKDGGIDEKKLTQDQKDRMQTEMPETLEIWSYAYFC